MSEVKSSLERKLEGEGWIPPNSRTRTSSNLNRRVLSTAQQRREEEQRLEAEREAAREQMRRAAAEARASSSPQVKAFPWVPVLAWASGIAVLLVPLIVVLAREGLRSSVLAQEKQSSAALACIDGEVTARDSGNLWTWLTGGSDFRCQNWETHESRKQRERDLAEERWRTREAARRQD